MKTSLKKNFIYNILYQLLILILPLITIPYISRIIGVTGIGMYSYTFSIVNYFMLFAMLGFNNYGNRKIAKVRDDKKKLSQAFKEIYILQIISVIFMILLYFIYLVFFCNKYRIISYIESLYVVSCLFDINWFFFGMEKFKLTVTRNVIIKIASFTLILLLVKTKNDVWIYTVILSCSTLLSQIFLLPFLKKYVDFRVKIGDLKKHIIPCLKLFLPVIAVTIYKVMDKTMLGLMSDINEVGFYENAEKIISVPIAIITALGTVMLPRMSNLFSKKEYEKIKEMIAKSIKGVMFLSFAMMMGLITISNRFSIMFFGDGFAKSGELIILLSSTIIFLSWGNVIRTQFLIPKEMDKEYIISAFLGAFVNFFMNLYYIPLYGSAGACYGTIAAEFVVMLYQTIKVRKYLPIIQYIKSIIFFAITSLIMYITIYFIGKLNISNYLIILIQIIAGMIIYVLLNFRYVFYELDILKSLKKVLANK